MIRKYYLPILLCLLWSTTSVMAENQVRLELKKSPADYTLLAHNAGVAPVLLDVQLQLSGGATSDRGHLIKTIVSPRSTITVAHIHLTHRPGKQGIYWRARQSVGDPSAVHDTQARYRLPFPTGNAFVVGQASGGRITTHNTSQSKDAVDITMPRGTRVLASRSGWVIDNVRYFGEGAPNPELLMRANYVRILHDDGTWAVYAHLDSFSNTLAPGRRVNAGEEIGRSGNSGYSSGPHLHFVVQKNGGAQPVSLPFQFWTQARGRFKPVQGERLFNPGAATP